MRVERDGLAFDVREAGPAAGERVLLLHGWPQDATAWDALVPGLVEAGYRTLAPDQRGYSPAARPWGRAAYRLEALVADALAVASRGGAARVHVVGHDWGGAVAWALAAWHPDRVRTLTVLSTPHPQAFRASLLGRQALASAYIAFFRLPRLPERVLLARRGAVLRAVLRRSGLPAPAADRYVARMREPGALRCALDWYRALGPSSGATVGRIAVPTLYVWGPGDPALARRAALATAAWVGGPYRFEVLGGAGHWLPETEAARLTPLLRDHLAAHR